VSVRLGVDKISIGKNFKVNNKLNKRLCKLLNRHVSSAHVEVSDCNSGATELVYCWRQLGQPIARAGSMRALIESGKMIAQHSLLRQQRTAPMGPGANRTGPSDVVFLFAFGPWQNGLLIHCLCPPVHMALHKPDSVVNWPEIC
jgi:hypothetical protein